MNAWVILISLTLNAGCNPFLFSIRDFIAKVIFMHGMGSTNVYFCINQTQLKFSLIRDIVPL